MKKTSLGKIIPKYREEYICLKCRKIIDAKCESCPECGSPTCARIVKSSIVKEILL